MFKKKTFFSAASEDPGGARQCEGPQPPRSQDELQKVTFAFNLNISLIGHMFVGNFHDTMNAQGMGKSA